MRKLGLWAVRPKRNTSKRHPEHKVYPYLLRGKTIDQPNKPALAKAGVWAADITYIAMRLGFLYLVAIIEWATRRVLSWRLSNTLTTGFCVEVLSEALARFGKPDIFNTDQSLPSRKRGVRNSPATSSPKSCGITASRSAWTDAVAATTTSSSSACGGQ
jgi:transposase InsO family protein